MLLWTSDGGLSPFFKSLQFPYSSPAAFAHGKKKNANGRLQTSAPARVLLRYINLVREMKHASLLLSFIQKTIIDGRHEKDQWCMLYGVDQFSSLCIARWSSSFAGTCFRFTRSLRKEATLPTWLGHKRGTRFESKWITCGAQSSNRYRYSSYRPIKEEK